jgi:diguanylate cyclase (GGDEF)-like protein
MRAATLAAAGKTAVSFRNRLTLFFIVIVIVPMIAVGLVLFRLVSDAERGKGDARLAQAQRGAQGLFSEFQDRAEQTAQAIGGDEELAAAIRDKDRAAVQARLKELIKGQNVQRVVLRLQSLGTFDLGDKKAIAPEGSKLIDENDKVVGDLTVSTVNAGQYVDLVKRVTRLESMVSRGSDTLSSTIEGADAEGLPVRGNADIEGSGYRIGGFRATGFDKRIDIVRVMADERSLNSGPEASTLLVGAALVGFLVLAFAFALTVSRSLQAQVQRLLDAARMLGAGNFAVEVPTEGNDEFAALGREFNSMARQLQTRLDELQLERQRLQEAIRRVGESFAKGLDRDALLRIVVQTAVDGVAASCGRAAVRQGPSSRLREVAVSGDVDSHLQALQAAEAAALDADEAAETQVGDTYAVARPLRAPERGSRVLGVISVARDGRAFTPGEKDLFNYLSNQAAVSIENVDLHETVQRQAVTDELTGLFNHRRFQEVMAVEVERARRFDQPMSLIMLDIDNFKRVNDTYGHMQGDLVLREVARVLRESSREIDEPARYGGEEMAVALPQTDLEGAYQFAERVRRRIEALELPILDGGGTLRVTASFGAASNTGAADSDKDALVAAADAALYRAKRSGKNRTVKAETDVGRL